MACAEGKFLRRPALSRGAARGGWRTIAPGSPRNPNTMQHHDLRISTDPAELDITMIHGFLAEESYWAKGLSRALLERAIAHSLCFGGFVADRQVAFARVVTDAATFAHLKDVFVLPGYRGRGYGIALVESILAHPDLRTVAMTLATADAHELYRRFGFGEFARPDHQMIRPGSFLTPHSKPV